MTDNPFPQVDLPLFREEVTNRGGSSWIGSANVCVPPSHTLLATIAASISMLLIAALVLVPYQSRCIVSGETSFTSPPEKIYATQTGKVASILSGEGDVAFSRKPIAYIDGESQDGAKESYTPIFPNHSGTIVSVNMRVGEKIFPGEVVATIQADDTTIIATLAIPANVVPYLHHGQKIHLSVDDLFQENPNPITGSLDRLVAADPGASARAPYQAIIALHHRVVMTKGGPLPIATGMHVSAQIELKKKSLMKWLLNVE